MEVIPSENSSDLAIIKEKNEYKEDEEEFNTALSVEYFRALVLRDTVQNINENTTVEELKNLTGITNIYFEKKSVFKTGLLNKLLYYKRVLVDDTNTSGIKVEIVYFNNTKGLGIFATRRYQRNSIIELFGYASNKKGVHQDMFPCITKSTMGSSSKTIKKKNQEDSNLRGRLDGTLALCNHACHPSNNCSFSDDYNADSQWGKASNSFKNTMKLNKNTNLFRLRIESNGIEKGQEILVNYNSKPIPCYCATCLDPLVVGNVTNTTSTTYKSRLRSRNQ